MILAHAENVAKRVIGIPDWEPFSWEKIHNGVLFEGSVPSLDVDGKKTWDSDETQKVVVTESEAHAEHRRYESETGKCGICFGEGKVFAHWHHLEGTTYKTCPTCGGSGSVKDGEVAHAESC